jgi:hypothetical protein
MVGEAAFGEVIAGEEITGVASVAERAGSRGSVDELPDPGSALFSPGATVART